jgi:hypothetical protein
MSIKLQNKDDYLIGVISDTHGYLHPSAVELFENTDLIIHAGDINKPEIISSLEKAAPVVAVRGNMDFGSWALKLPETEAVEIGTILVYIIHNLQRLDIKPDSAGFNVIISGHTHEPCIINKNGVLFLNPGSATLPKASAPSAALLHINKDSVHAEIIEFAKTKREFFKNFFG